MAKKSKEEDDDLDAFGDIDESDDSEIEEGVTGILNNYEIRRRLERVQEEKALARLINDDFYD